VNERRNFSPFRLALSSVLLWASPLQFAGPVKAQASRSKTQPPRQESRAPAAKGTRIRIPKILRSEVKANHQGCLEIAPDRHIRFNAYELLQKNGKLVMLWGGGSCFCAATGNCDFWVYHLHRGSGELLLQGELMNDFGFLKATTNGVPDLVTWSHDSADRSSGKLWKFDGSAYVVQCSWKIHRSFRESSNHHWDLAEEHVEGNSCDDYDENGKTATKNRSHAYRLAISAAFRG